MVSNTQLAWAAGFFEGEGCAACYKSKYIRPQGVRYWRHLIVRIDQKTPSALRWLKHTFKYGRIYRYKNNKGPTKRHITNWMYVWRIGARQAKDFLLKIRPFLKSVYKRNQVNRALYLNAKWTRWEK